MITVTREQRLESALSALITYAKQQNAARHGTTVTVAQLESLARWDAPIARAVETLASDPLPTIWADVYQSGGLWHFNVFRHGDGVAYYRSRFVDGRLHRADAVAQATEFVRHALES